MAANWTRLIVVVAIRTLLEPFRPSLFEEQIGTRQYLLLFHVRLLSVFGHILTPIILLLRCQKSGCRFSCFIFFHLVASPLLLCVRILLRSTSQVKERRSSSTTGRATKTP